MQQPRKPAQRSAGHSIKMLRNGHAWQADKQGTSSKQHVRAKHRCKGATVLTASQQRLHGARMQQPSKCRPAQRARAMPALAGHAACAGQAAVEVQAAVVVWVHARAHGLHVVEAYVTTHNVNTVGGEIFPDISCHDMMQKGLQRAAFWVVVFSWVSWECCFYACAQQPVRCRPGRHETPGLSH